MHTSMQCHHIATRDTPSIQMSAVLSCGNVDLALLHRSNKIKNSHGNATITSMQCCVVSNAHIHCYIQNICSPQRTFNKLYVTVHLNARPHQFLEHFISQTARELFTQ
ncbi:hypothetical protein V1478_010320 [Vespula squamosa]|uniref:Uncharacterized protein n=1 Tax=Vespula squamosa TaxID=30214 RepID=A0ABD2AHF3_VESSQ